MTSNASHPEERRVVVTGCGAISPLGLTVPELWDGLLAGRSGVAPLTAFDASEYPTRIAGEVKGFEPERYLDRPSARRLASFTQYAIAATQEAMADAALTLDEERSWRTGVILGTGYGANLLTHNAALTLRDRGVRFVGAHFASVGASDSASGEIAMRFGARGPSQAVTTACATGAVAVGDAARWIRTGVADVVIAGGAEDSVTAVDIAAACNAKALSRRNDDPEAASRPFDRDRDGFVMAAGAGVVVLESLAHARRRGAEILGEIAGYGATTDAHHATAPHPEGLGAKQAMRLALADAGVEPDAIDYVNAHGTGTRLNDTIEVGAIREVLGDHATSIPVSSTKSMTGHMIGAAGTVEVIVTLLAMRDGVVPPTLNCHDPEDPDMNFVPHKPQHWDTRVALSNSFGFGGHNAAVVTRRWDG